jgi:predicted metal-dependent HD superfamily phosphohydrolase
MSFPGLLIPTHNKGYIMETDLRQRWLNLNHDIASRDDLITLWNEIEERYEEPYRAYHNLKHIQFMLQEFDTLREYAVHPLALEWAIWFHDLYYIVGSKDNERRSADRAAEAAVKIGLPSSFAEEVHRAIMATQFHNALDSDSQLIITLDLAVLGGNDEEFSRYDMAIKEEARSHPLYTDDFYRQKRLEWATAFVQRDPIYPTDYGRNRFESAAKKNLRGLIERLSA